MPFKRFALSSHGKNATVTDGGWGGGPQAIIPESSDVPNNAYIEMEIWPHENFTSEVVKATLIDYGLHPSRVYFKNSNPHSKAFSCESIAGIAVAMVRQSQFNSVVRCLSKNCPGVSIGTKFLQVERYDGSIGDILRFDKVNRLNSFIVEWDDGGTSTHALKDLLVNDRHRYEIPAPPDVQARVDDIAQTGLAGEARWEKI